MFKNTDLIDQMERLQKFACKLTRNQADADDLLQSTILRAIEKKHLFEDGTNLYSWTSKVMFNLFASEYRRKTKFETQYDPDIFLNKESVKAKQDINVELQDVQAAIDELSDDHREILVMVCVQGMQYAEVSEKLQIPVGTVRSRLSRARESLQMELDTPRFAQRGGMLSGSQNAIYSRLAA
jgi:RNA polymerase sigma-70 factor (ECF subfamily)